MFESRISAGATEKLPGWEKPHAKFVARSYDVEGHARFCVERNCELANKKVEQVYKVSSPCLDDHQFKQEEPGSVGELSQVCSQTVLKLFVLVTNWKTRHSVVCQQTCTSSHKNGLRHATDDWQDWFHTFITHMNSDSIVMWATLLSIVYLVYVKTQTLLATLRTQKSTSGGVLCIFGSRTFITISWMCKRNKRQYRQTTLQDVVNQPKETCAGQETIPSIKTKPKHQPKGESEILSNCQMWITYPPTHILLKASLSCTFLNTTKLSSRWVSKDEVQQWDTCPEPTELRLIGCLTESIRNQRSKSIVLTPKINLPTC